MEHILYPDPNETYPLEGNTQLCFLKNIIKNPNIKVGDFTYYHDFDDVYNFEKNVKYHFSFIGDQLQIGKFCQIASGVTFIMNGGNHLTATTTTYPFAIFGKAWAGAMEGKQYPNKGNTVVGNDVWIGNNATIMPGVTIGDGAIIATNATVTKDVAPYSIVGGNPAQLVKKRFTEARIQELLALQWWHWSIAEITARMEELMR